MTAPARLRLPGRLLLGLTLGGAALAGVPTLMRERGWAPWVVLAGGGDAQRAATRLEESLGTLGVLFGGGLRVDEPTREFVSGLRGSLASFDLEGFHALLPEQDGAWRQVRIVGRREGSSYQVSQAAPGTATAIDPARGALGSQFGDLLLQARTRPVAREDRTNYVGALDLGVGVGQVGWGQLLAGLRETGRLLASGDPAGPGSVRDNQRRASAETRLRILEAHPRLRPEDVEVLGVLWEAYPHSSAFAATLGTVEDLLVYDPKGTGAYQQLRLRLRLDPARLETRYPDLAEFVRELGPLFQGELTFRDAQRRNLLRLQFDTGKLEVAIEGFLCDGRLVPVGHDGQIVLDAPSAIPGLPVTFTAEGSSTFNVNGIETRVRGLELRSTYLEQPLGADLVTTITRPPVVAVSGSAYGFLPTWAIDVVIPGNIEELTREFLTTACTGNDGRGITLGLQARQAGPQGAATLRSFGACEVLNSLLVQLAARIANEKLLPSEAARGQLWAVFQEAHQAFLADFQAWKDQLPD